MKMIITDSTANLPPAIIKKYGIEVVPLNVHLPDMDFKEGEIPNSEYYRRLQQEKIFPHTSQPSPAEFLALYNRLGPEDEAIVILISSHLSGTIQSALLARDMFKDSNRITVIDSYSSAMGLGFQVIKACELAEQAKSTSDIKREVENLQARLKLYFVVDTMEYLARGGRISHVKGFIGNILKVKPILTLVNGQIRLYEKVRTRQKALEVILHKLEQDLPDVQEVTVLHVEAPEEAKMFAEKVSHIFPCSIIGDIGPVIGTHVGPGTLALVYY